MAVLMPLDIKRHTVPHLKALTYNIELRGGNGHGSTFKQRYTVLFLLHKWPKRWFHVTVAVGYDESSFKSCCRLFMNIPHDQCLDIEGQLKLLTDFNHDY